MKKPLYTIASLITILLISERAIDVFFGIGPFAPESVKLLFIVTALILFVIHFTKSNKKPK
tara:strand:+ start:469 stop:651 length:183 start_codon:yes stop_codon:yes gene_type:complete